MGQGRAGFYTYDRLEQMVGAAIRSTDLIVPELQQLAVGDTIPLSPVGGPIRRATGPGPRAGVVRDDGPAHWPIDTFSTPHPVGDGLDLVVHTAANPAGATRLLVRTRAAYRPRALLGLALPVLLEPAHFVMERGMLLGIKRRAETVSSVPTTATAGTVGTAADLVGDDFRRHQWPGAAPASARAWSGKSRPQLEIRRHAAEHCARCSPCQGKATLAGSLDAPSPVRSRGIRRIVRAVRTGARALALELGVDSSRTGDAAFWRYGRSDSLFHTRHQH